MRRLCVRPSARLRFGAGRWVGFRRLWSRAHSRSGRYRGRRRTASARASMSAFRASRAARISVSITPWACGVRPAMRCGGLRARPDPAGRVVVRSMRWWRAAAMSSASPNPRAATRRGRSASRLWWLASARRSSAVSGPSASDWMARSASSVVRPEVRRRLAQRSCWAAATMVSRGCAGTSRSPAVVLGGGDGLIFGGELRDRAPLVVFGGDGLVGGEFGSGVL